MTDQLNQVRRVDSKPNPRVKTTDRPIRDDLRRAITETQKRAVDRARKNPGAG
jgi:hypothetical protein